MYYAYEKGKNPDLLKKEFEIGIYSDHHNELDDVLKDLKNILIRHLPQIEKGNTRKNVLQLLFEFESDLYSHARMEDDILIPLVRELEQSFELVASK